MAPGPAYFDPRALAKLRGLKLRARHIVEGYLAGMHRGPRQGYSVEFAEHRAYSPGDELRHVDWKVFAKTDRIHVKRFEEETSLTCYLLVDMSASMAYQGPASVLSKYEYARCLAAAVAYLVLRQKDRVALAGFDEETRLLVQPAGRETQFSSILRALETPPTKGRTQSAKVFGQLAERLRRRGVVVVFSDLLDWAEDVIRGLHHLRHKRHDVIVFQVLDPAELDFPFVEYTRFRGLEGGGDVVLDPGALRAAYREEISRVVSDIANRCRAAGIDHVVTRTDTPFDEALSRYFSRRVWRA